MGDPAQTLALIARLAEPAGRRAAAQALARASGATDLLVFVPDPELGALLPAPGFPQTLPEGRAWRSFLASCTPGREYVGTVPWPTAAQQTTALGIASASGSVVVLLGGMPTPEALATLQQLLPLLTAAFRGERAALTAAGHAAAAREAAEHGRRVAETLDAARRDLQQALRARDEFLSVAAHELKTPITGLRGYVHLLLRQLDRTGQVDPARLKQALKVIDEQSAKLTRLISQLLDVSRIEAGKLTLEREVTDLAHLAESVAALAQASTDRHAISVQAPGPILALVDPIRLEQVLTNLVDNAIRYSPGGGAVEIEVAESPPGDVRLAVRDHGLGVPPDQRERIFERFHQAHDSQWGGMGLGLYVSQQIVALHRGRFEVESPPDGGARFVVLLPACLESAASEPLPPSATTHEPLAPGRRP
jgi:signal transduction histidine kinase